MRKSSPTKTDIEKIFQRDGYACRFCGFRSRQFQRVVPHAGETPAFVTSCTFCEQCLALERSGIMGSGVLVWLPEMSQAQLNHLARSIYVAKSSGNEDIAALAQRALDALLARRGDAKKRLGSDDPLLLATVMHETLSDEEAAQAEHKLDGIRLLPLDKHQVRGKKGDFNQFPQIVRYWLSPEGPYAEYPPAKWAEMFKSASASIGHA